MMPTDHDLFYNEVVGDWQRWFAWHPVRTPDGWRWWRIIERRMVIIIAPSFGKPNFHWHREYRSIGGVA